MGLENVYCSSFYSGLSQHSARWMWSSPLRDGPQGAYVLYNRPSFPPPPPPHTHTAAVTTAPLLLATVLFMRNPEAKPKTRSTHFRGNCKSVCPDTVQLQPLLRYLPLFCSCVTQRPSLKHGPHISVATAGLCVLMKPKTMQQSYSCGKWRCVCTEVNTVWLLRAGTNSCVSATVFCVGKATGSRVIVKRKQKATSRDDVTSYFARRSRIRLVL
jgi:hypothetical protein